jgi:hypothetical protein
MAPSAKTLVEQPEPPAPEPPLVDLQPMRDTIATAAWADAGFSHSDGRLMTLADALRGQLDLALAVWEEMPQASYRRQAVERAVLLAAGDEDRDIVLRWLDRAPWLAATLASHHWTAEAAPWLRSRLADHDRKLPQDAITWARALASLDDAEDDAVLTETLGRLSDATDQNELGELLRRRPACDWRTAVRTAWSLRPAFEPADIKLPLVFLALQAGEPAAATLIPAALATDRGSKRHAALRSYVLEQPAFGGMIPESEWLAKHKDRLVFRNETWQLSDEHPDPAGPPPAPSPHAGSPRPLIVADTPIPAPPAGLSAHADAAAVRAWIDAIAPTVAERKTIQNHDPTVIQLASIPPERLDEVIAASDRHITNWAMRAYCEKAALRMIRQQHRELVLAALPRHAFLVRAVIDKGWQDLAAPTLRRMLRDPMLATQYGERVDMVHALSHVGDPADHALLRDVLLDMRYGYHQAAMAVALRDLPGFDFDGAVRAAWGRRPPADYGDRQEAFSVVAASCGVAEALPIAVAHATGGQVAWVSGSLTDEAIRTLARQFGTTAEAAAVADWWTRSRGRVRWDPANRRWLMIDPPADASAPWSANAGGF